MDEQPDNEHRPRRGSARWRQQRRKDRQIEQQSTQRSPTKRRQRQVMPVERVKLPEIKMSRQTKGAVSGVAYAILAVVLVVGMIFLLRLFNPPEAVNLSNAIWLGSGWSYNTPTDEDVEELVDRLRQNRIGTAYVWVSFLKDDLTWSGKTADRNLETGQVINTINPATGEDYRNELAEMEPNIIRFVEQYSAAYPEGKLYGWISFPTNLGNGERLADPVLHTRIAELSAVLVSTYGFDGIYLNVEPVFDGDEGFLDLLRTVRRTLDDLNEARGIDERIPIAVAVPPDWRPSDPSIPYGSGFTRVFEWSLQYKQSVALLSDEVLIMAYNSGIDRADDFSVWVAYQTQAYAQAVAELGIETDVLVGVATYPLEPNFREDLPPAHDPDVENIATAIDGVRSGLVQAGEAAEVIRGLTIYAEWTTDESEWAMFYNGWINPPN